MTTNPIDEAARRNLAAKIQIVLAKGGNHYDVADAILAAFPQLAAPSGNEAENAARETIALWHDDGKPLTKHALTMARYLIGLAPGQYVTAAERAAAIRAGGGK